MSDDSIHSNDLQEMIHEEINKLFALFDEDPEMVDEDDIVEIAEAIEAQVSLAISALYILMETYQAGKKRQDNPWLNKNIKNE